MARLPSHPQPSSTLHVSSNSSDRSSARITKVVVRYLEMKSPAELRARRSARADVVFTRIEPPWPELNRFFYTGVGGAHYWVDRLPWTREQWMQHLSRPELETWV